MSHRDFEANYKSMDVPRLLEELDRLRGSYDGSAHAFTYLERLDRLSFIAAELALKRYAKDNPMPSSGMGHC